MPAKQRVFYVAPPEPHASSQIRDACVRVRRRGRERERYSVVPLNDSAFLLPELLRAKCAQEMLLSALILPFHSLTLSFPLARSPTPSLSVPPPPTPLLSSSSYITSYACMSCCSLIALRAVCNHWKGFPASVHKVEFTDGDTIQPALQASPPSLAILQSIHLSSPFPSLYCGFMYVSASICCHRNVRVPLF